MENSRLNIRRVSGVTVIELVGEHDLSTVRGLEGALGRVGGARPCVVDLSAAAFIDSSILNALMQRAPDGERPRWLGVVAPATGAAARLLEITGAAGILPVYTALDDALARARSLPLPAGGARSA